MKDHILEFIKSGTRLYKKRGLLSVNLNDQEVQIPFADISGVIIISEDVTLSSAVMSELLNQGVCIQILNEKYLPQGLLTPYVGNKLMKGRLMAQLALSEAQTNRLWQKIVIKKIENQSRVLFKLGFENQIMEKFKCEVSSGDTQNHEAQAARYYWSVIFGDKFRREPEAVGINSFLNYGYSIIRSATARYIVACGLNPSLGIFHHNLENPFCLVDDLMEPFRPLIDLYCNEFTEEVELTPSIKKKLVDVLEHEVEYFGEIKPLRNAISEYCQSFTKAILNSDFKIFNTDVEVFDVEQRRV
jgi:CRISPR-associated protein Cas1